MNPYCSLAQLKAELHLSVADTSLDSELEQAIERASRWIDDYKGKTYYALDFTTTPWTIPPRSRHLCLDVIFPPYGTIRSVTKIMQAGVQMDASLYSVVDGTIELMDGFWSNNDVDLPIQVYGLFGYAQPSEADADIIDSALVPTGLPNKITMATILVAAAFSGHNRKDVVGFDGSKQSVQDRAIPDEVYLMLGQRALVL